MKTWTLLITAFLLNTTTGLAQTDNQKKAIGQLLEADSLATGNIKDMLTQFFQLSLNQIISPGKELQFASNPYAVLLKSDPRVAIDTNYVRYKYLRKINFNFGLKLDSSFRFNGFSSGIRYAIINQRDSTTSRTLYKALGQDPVNREMGVLLERVNDSLNRLQPTPAFPQEKIDAYFDQLNELVDDSAKTWDEYDAGFRTFILQMCKTHNLNQIHSLLSKGKKINLKRESTKPFSELKQELQNKLLWTFSVADTTYQDQFMFSNIVFQSELLKGLSKAQPGSNWELNLLASLNLTDDQQLEGRDLGRSVFRFDPAVNYVFRNRNGGASIFEFKMGARYQHIFNGMLPGEKTNELIFQSVFRVRIINDLWLPLEINYDPASGNILGFLSARFNFSAIGKKNQ